MSNGNVGRIHLVSANGYDGIKEYIRKTFQLFECVHDKRIPKSEAPCCLENSFERILVYKRESIFVRNLEEV